MEPILKLPPSDEELVKLTLADKNHFGDLVDRYEAKLRRYIARLGVRNAEDQEDVLQDIFLKTYRNLNGFDTSLQFSSWAYRILMNTAFTRYQKLIKDGQRYVAIDPEYEQLYGEMKEHSGFQERRDGIERILQRMPGHFAFVLKLHYLERWSHQAIAEETGENVGTIKARIHRAKAAFKKEGNEGEAEALL